VGETVSVYFLPSNALFPFCQNQHDAGRQIQQDIIYQVVLFNPAKVNASRPGTL
jgi:hypothetical protein